MSTFDIRQKLLAIARHDVGKKEVTKNTAPWIGKLWPATSYPDGMENREPYCAAGVAYCVREWLQEKSVLYAFAFNSFSQADLWRCKSASVFKADDSWLNWAKKAQGVKILPKHCVLHAADLAVYTYSHIEMVSDDDGTTDGAFIGLGYNTNASASADGEGCFEKPRTRNNIQCFIRMLE